jgi:hypothetical protein
MTIYRKQRISAEEFSEMFKFLDAYASRTHVNDVGGLFGQLSALRHGMPAEHDSQWRKAVSLAVAAC